MKNRSAAARKQNKRDNELNRDGEYKAARTTMRSKTATVEEKDQAYKVFQETEGTHHSYHDKIPAPGIGVQRDPRLTVAKPVQGGGEAEVRSHITEPRKVWVRSAPVPPNPTGNRKARRAAAHLERQEAAKRAEAEAASMLVSPSSPHTSVTIVAKPEHGDGEAMEFSSE